jgi:hypothetical protein
MVRNGCLIGIMQQAFEQERQHRQENAIAQRHRKHRRNEPMEGGAMQRALRQIAHAAEAAATLGRMHS